MLARTLRLAALLALTFTTSASFAADVIEYTQKNLSDGSQVMDYSSQDGSRLRQVRHPDGTITTTQVDTDGNKKISRQHPDGSVETQTENTIADAN